MVWLIALSIVFLVYSFTRCLLNMKHVPHQSIGAYWKVLTGLTVLFIFGYAFYEYTLITGLDISLERWIIALVFFGGSLFVLLVTSCSRQAFSEITALQREAQRHVEVLAEEIKKRNKEIDVLITTDPATGLNNHKSFMRRLNEEIERSARYGSHFYILRFLINDIKTEMASGGIYDHVLQSVGLVVKKCIRNRIDCACRCTNNEFSVLLANTSKEEAVSVAQRMITELSQKNIDISIGMLAFMPGCGLTIDDIVKLSEKAAGEAQSAAKHSIHYLERVSPEGADILPFRSKDNR